MSDEVCELLLAKLQQALEGRPELRRCRVQPGLRLIMRKNRASLSLGFPSEGDEIVSYKGRPVLIMTAKDFGELARARFLLRRQGSESRLALECQELS